MSLNRSHLPAWLERNPVFRRLFLLRKLYLTRARASHYSQFAEDVSIDLLFPKDYRGFFVDVGCFHPRKYSNTWRLYKKGWRGINIDIDPIKIEGFNIARPHDTNISSAVSDAEGEISYFTNGFYSLFLSLDRNAVQREGGYIEKKTRCARLTRLIDETGYRDREIDFLSVDAEGHDLQVLKSLDFDRYHPKLIAVETLDALFDEVRESALYAFLLSKGYCLVGWCGLTLLMAGPSLQRELARLRR